MRQEDKELLLKDLSSRLPYGIKIDNNGEPSILTSINNRYRIIVEIFEVGKEPKLDVLEIDDCKPYLFPLSSMTEKQKKEYGHILVMSSNLAYSQLLGMTVEDWLNKNHFDYRGLIPMGLAIDATRLGIYENR